MPLLSFPRHFFLTRRGDIVLSRSRLLDPDLNWE
jgi:hypothetical protein